MRRFFDLMVVCLSLPVTVPVILLIGAAIRCEGKGPVFYRSSRIGRFKKPFTMFKFRSMLPDGDSILSSAQVTEFNASFKIKNDPRVTTLGSWLRRTSLDELPQLLNVLKGEMNLVGPRPKLPEEIGLFGERADELLSVAPGITGYWQLYRSSAASDSSMVAMELQYVRHRSFLKDCALLLRTPGRMLFQENE